MKRVSKIDMMTLCPLPLTYWTQNQWASIDCHGLLLCQVSSHADQGFSFIMLTYTPTLTRIVTKWSLYPRLRTTSSARITLNYINRRHACNQSHALQHTQTVQHPPEADKDIREIHGIFSETSAYVRQWVVSCPRFQRTSDTVRWRQLSGYGSSLVSDRPASKRSFTRKSHISQETGAISLISSRI